MWEILSGSPPFPNVPAVQVAIQVANQGLRPLVPKQWPGFAKRLLFQCWRDNEKKRPSFDELKKTLLSFSTVETANVPLDTIRKLYRDEAPPIGPFEYPSSSELKNVSDDLK